MDAAPEVPAAVVSLLVVLDPVGANVHSVGKVSEVYVSVPVGRMVSGAVVCFVVSRVVAGTTFGEVLLAVGVTVSMGTAEPVGAAEPMGTAEL